MSTEVFFFYYNEHVPRVLIVREPNDNYLLFCAD